MPLLPWPKTIPLRPSSSQIRWSAGQIVTAAPPLTRNFLESFHRRASKKAMDRPSGENTGLPASRSGICCAGMGLASRSDIDRRYKLLIGHVDELRAVRRHGDRSADHATNC